MADALYACRLIAEICQKYDWKYILTLKEGRQPTTWQETLKLLSLNRNNRLRLWLGQDGKEGLQDFRWVEDAFNTQKNNGIGMEHVFCANATASQNYYTMLQVAQVLWILTCQGLARAVWEGLRARRLPPDLPPLGQIRFGFS